MSNVTESASFEIKEHLRVRVCDKCLSFAYMCNMETFGQTSSLSFEFEVWWSIVSFQIRYINKLRYFTYMPISMYNTCWGPPTPQTVHKCLVLGQAKYLRYCTHLFVCQCTKYRPTSFSTTSAFQAMEWSWCKVKYALMSMHLAYFFILSLPLILHKSVSPSTHFEFINKQC